VIPAGGYAPPPLTTATPLARGARVSESESSASQVPQCPLAGGRSLSYTGQHLSMCVSAASCGLRAVCYAQLFLSLASVVPLPNFPCCCI